MISPPYQKWNKGKTVAKHVYYYTIFRVFLRYFALLTYLALSSCACKTFLAMRTIGDEGDR